MDQNIVNYLEQNKNTYSKEVLIEELKKAGHTEVNILEAVGYVFESNPDLQALVPQVFNFWDFKTKIVYQNSSQKRKDFLFGFFVPFLGTLFSVIIPIIGAIFSMLLFVVEVVALFYLWNRRRSIVYGLLINFVFMICVGFLIAIWIAGGISNL